MLGGMVGGPKQVDKVGFAAMRPVFVGIMLVVDAGVVLGLLISQHKGWLPPFIGFTIVLVGLIWFMRWSIEHRHDDDRSG